MNNYAFALYFAVVAALGGVDTTTPERETTGANAGVTNPATAQDTGTEVRTGTKVGADENAPVTADKDKKDKKDKKEAKPKEKEKPKKDGKVVPYPLETCIVTDNKLGAMGDEVTMVYEGQEIKFCCKPCKKKFEKEPARYLPKLKPQAK